MISRQDNTLFSTSFPCVRLMIKHGLANQPALSCLAFSPSLAMFYGISQASALPLANSSYQDLAGCFPSSQTCREYPHDSLLSQAFNFDTSEALVKRLCLVVLLFSVSQQLWVGDFSPSP